MAAASLPSPSRPSHALVRRPATARANSAPFASASARRPDMRSPLLPEEEYARLPVSIQRKYFSSLERLRIAEAVSAPSWKHSSDSTTPPALFSPSSRPPSLLLQRSGSRPRRRLRKQQSLRHEHDISQAEAEWFLSLPDKIRRRQFSHEEQAVLAGRCETACPDATDDGLRTLSSYRLQAALSHHSLSDASIAPEQPGREPEAERGRTRRRRPHSLSSAASRATDGPAASREPSIIHIDRMPPAEPPAPPPRRRRASFRRTLSLSANPFSRNSTSSAPAVPLPPLFPRTSGQWRPRAHSNAGTRSEPPLSFIDPEAKHYQDPEARMKLRVYLASPARFDEAIEFGFPSSSAAEPAPSLQGKRNIDRFSKESTVRSSSHFAGPHVALPSPTDPRKMSLDVQTFLKDDTVSFLNDTESDDNARGADDASSISGDGPTTPSDTGEAFDYAPPTPPDAPDAPAPTGLPFHARPKAQALFAQAFGGSREMTLRMTLTRPDLRANEAVLYGWQKPAWRERDDPLALEELPMTDDVNGSHCPFPVHPHRHQSLVKRFLSKVKKAR